MNPEQQDFEKLRQLMALKRHEQPPPAYLSHLHDNIIARIEDGEGETTFWERFSSSFTLRPGMVYAFGLTMCGALALSSIYVMDGEDSRSARTARGVITRPAPPAPAYVSAIAPDNGEIPLHVANWLRNTNPTPETQPQLSLFDTPPAAVSVSYQPGR